LNFVSRVGRASQPLYVDFPSSLFGVSQTGRVG
jgi:hypothetical protein